MQLAANCRARGFDFYGISGYRSPTEQAKLYFQGRTTAGKIVTSAGPGLSLHQYGLAVDFALDGDTTRDGLQPDWAIEHYQPLAEEARKLGLESGLDWTRFREAPHVQAPIGKFGVRVTQLRGLIQSPGGSMARVWEFMDLHLKGW